MKSVRTISTTEFRQKLSAAMSSVDSGPVTITKKNKPVAVLMSPERYHELKKLEDILHTKATKLAIQQGILHKGKIEVWATDEDEFWAGMADAAKNEGFVRTEP